MTGNESNDLFKDVLAATRAQVEAEQERIAIEKKRIEIERKRLELEEENKATLQAIANNMQMLFNLYNDVYTPLVREQGERTKLISEFVKLSMLRTGDSGKDIIERQENIIAKLIESSTREQTMKIDMTAQRDINTGDIIENSAGISEEVLLAIIDALSIVKEEDDISSANQILSTIPADAVDLALAAMQGPMGVLGVLVQKIAGKIKLKRV